VPRDYAKKPRKKTASATRRTGKQRPQKTPITPGWAWALAGLALGLFVAFLVYLNEHRPARQSTASSETASRSKASTDKNATEKPRFDFYTILPEQEVVVPERSPEEERQNGASEREKAKYLLQAGSFRTLSQADSLRARLALLGVEAGIETVRVKGGETWHRVRVGPFNSVREVAKIQERLRRKEIQTLRVKIKG